MFFYLSRAATEAADIREDSLLASQTSTLTQEDKDLLSVYHHSFDDDKVDLDLILSLVHKIHSSQQEGQYYFTLTCVLLCCPLFLLITAASVSSICVFATQDYLSNLPTYEMDLLLLFTTSFRSPLIFILHFFLVSMVALSFY